MNPRPTIASTVTIADALGFPPSYIEKAAILAICGANKAAVENAMEASHCDYVAAKLFRKLRDERSDWNIRKVVFMMDLCIVFEMEAKKVTT